VESGLLGQSTATTGGTTLGCGEMRMRSAAGDRWSTVLYLFGDLARAWGHLQIELLAKGAVRTQMRALPASGGDWDAWTPIQWESVTKKEADAG
jgi:hypothetical protein